MKTNELSAKKVRCSEGFCKKEVLKDFAKLTGKHLYQSSFLNKVDCFCLKFNPCLVSVLSIDIALIFIIDNTVKLLI